VKKKTDPMTKLTHAQYLACFGIAAPQPPATGNAAVTVTPVPAGLEKTFELVVETRQFEIQMYWTRTAYFWTLIGAAFAGYFAVVASSAATSDKQFLGFTISAIGFVLSFGWGLANKGSKYWHENWENHAQILENYTVGPIFKTLLERVPPDSAEKYISQVVTGPAKYSVSKVNILFSWFFSMLWLGLAYISLPPYVEGANIDDRYVVVGGIASASFLALLYFSRTWDRNQRHHARQRKTEIV
jgi:hypothetical protein